ncbi:SOS response-associated peptidase [Amorphus sp. 3PC139-8]|uniref:SOS response-associated peptidase n=1 Tax=Amorphus sp. 3PC139-8 TaxID=2735676 RepID=UPI00345CAF5A
MCGRYTLVARPEEVQALFDALEAHQAPPRYNIAPSQPILIVREDQPGVRRLVLVRWGLIPGWAKDPSKLANLINARSETAIDKPSFRTAMRHKRCLIPASGFYEWQKRKGTRSQPYLIRPSEGDLVAFAGIWEDWTDPDGGVIETAAILTTAANATLSPIHDRMPAVVQPEDFALWLDTRSVDAKTATSILRPAPEDTFEAVAIGSRVNAVGQDDPGIQNPVDPVSSPPADEPAPDSKPDKGQFDLFD